MKTIVILFNQYLFGHSLKSTMRNFKHMQQKLVQNLVSNFSLSYDIISYINISQHVQLVFVIYMVTTILSRAI